MFKSVGTTQEFTFISPSVIEPEDGFTGYGEYDGLFDEQPPSRQGDVGSLSPLMPQSDEQVKGKRKRNRNGMGKEGKEVSEMTDEELQQLNERWGFWMETLEYTLRWYAWGDEDLTQVGIINLG